ncbi:MAG TPA: hypothetical protein VKH42_13460 [Vicinamibacterales bacterium]|nr:hypothetical protein [Vicinamibacterales bacterium]
MKRPAALLLSALFAVAAGSTRVLAQVNAPRSSSNGVFDTRPYTATGQRLDVTFSTNEGYDHDVLPQTLDTIDLVGPSGASTNVLGSARYAWFGRHAQFRAAGESTLRSYNSLGDLPDSSYATSSHSEATAFSYRTAKNNFVAYQTASYSSSLLNSLFPQSGEFVPGDAPTVASAYAVRDSQVYSYNAGTEFTRKVTARNSVSASVDWQHADTFGAKVKTSSLNASRLRFRFSRDVSRNTTATAGYSYRLGDVVGLLPVGGLLEENGAEIGIDYRHPISKTRRLTVQTRVGIASIADPGLTPEAGLNGQHYRQFSAQVSALYDIGRTWQAGGEYRRGNFEYVAGLREPVTSDNFSLRVEGLLTRRLEGLASIVHSVGKSALNRTESFYETYNGDVRLRFALTRTVAAYGEYVYGFYDSRGTAPVIAGLPPSLERNGIRAGFTLRVSAAGK